MANTLFKANTMHCGDSLVLMKNIPDACIDLIITDPPFGIEFKAKRLNYNRKSSRVLEGYNEVHVNDYAAFSHAWITEAYRILKDTGSMFVCSGWNNLKDILIALDDTGFVTQNHIIWKYQFGVFTRRKFVTSHYHIPFAVKEPKKYKFHKVDHYPEDVWEIKREYWSGKIKTPTKLPEELVRKMILYGSDKGDLVFDPFIGSGTVAVVASHLGRNYLGFEIVRDYYDFACERVRNSRQQHDMFT